MHDIELIIVDINKDLCREIQVCFEGLERVSVVNGSFTDIKEWDCIITPGNSYGIMDGGFDLHVSRFFGPQLEHRVRGYIFAMHASIQPVGTALIVPTKDQKHPYVAYAPTMRTPMPIFGTINVFLAMKAALQAIQNHNDTCSQDGCRPIRKVICPGFGTATGHVAYDVAAHQMRIAYELVYEPLRRVTWEKVEEFERKLARRTTCRTLR
ncbi:O-acetyl-ADP-ribose deacetylase (regulator of RNase III), contains Macro domain [Paenibacillus sp. UNCCL117]|uniref:macro domain-containing protein n=1 Tax=unclassified Paenibacillus TaxID=185978 RepID=UPI000880E774|nr:MULTISPECIES: macro domain-containing protein [unclassified Paenibacillus]SDD26747.1 O-acetyl-ADP-ribose deacetylase (regulator of RNase III), contains Macro domain [Paenibacillus sp. cl123]SFW40673.1 O-acetyl-ADP-ribose deacetylase (regulator of RNase III), contains Macro domain [Paenibacillus sp. UNCCL117]